MPRLKVFLQEHFHVHLCTYIEDNSEKSLPATGSRVDFSTVPGTKDSKAAPATPGPAPAAPPAAKAAPKGPIRIN